MKLSAILIVLLAVPCFLAQDKTPEKQPDLPEGAGKATVVRLCGKCHSLDRFANARKSREDWESIVERMGEAGLKMTDEEYETVVTYLAKYLGRS
jgi:competence protein ComEA